MQCKRIFVDLLVLLYVTIKIMGAVNENESQKQVLQIQLQKILLEITYEENVITFKGYSCTKKTLEYLVYDASYDNQSLPQDMYDYFGSIQNLMIKTQKYKNKIKIDNQSNLVISTRIKIFRLPLLANNNQDQIHLQKQNFHPVKPVHEQKILQLPYSAAVLIISNSPNCQFKGSGAIVGKSIVLTVAHVVYDRSTKSEATKSSVWIQTEKGLQQIKVKKIYFPPQYKFISQQDVHKYDFAHLQLEDNQIISVNNILPIKWNYNEPLKDFEVMGFSRKLDVQFKVKENSVFHLRCNRTVKLLENFITYDNKAEGGISGGPIVSFQNNVFYLIGLHQGMLANFSRGVLLTSFGKNPYQILSSFSNHYALPPSSSIKKSNQIQKEQQIIKLKQEIQKIKKQKETQQAQKLKFKQENQNFKKQLQLEDPKNIALDQASIKESKKLIFNKNNEIKKDSENNFKNFKNIKISKVQKKQKKQKQIFQLDIGDFFNIQILNFEKKATKIYLSQCNLTDEHFQKLTQNLQLLEQIKIYDCKLLKCLELKNMNNLKKLEVSHVSITEIKLQNLPKIQEVIFDECIQVQYVAIINCEVLKGIDLSSLSQLYELHLQNLSEAKSLTFKNCQNLSKFKAINCKQLKILNLEGAQLSKVRFQILQRQLQLQEMNLKKCSKIKKVQFFNSKQLKKVNLSETMIKNQELEMIAKQLPDLEHLDLEKCSKLTQFSIACCVQLRTLNLRGTKITDSIINQLTKKMPKLTNLCLGGYDRKQSISFSTCKQLLSLDIYASNLTETQLKQLSQLKRLEELNFCGSNTFQGFTFINYKYLKKLNLSHSKINEQKLNQLCNSLPNLLQLNLFGCKDLKKISLQNLKRLKVLDISQSNIIEANLSQNVDLIELNIQNYSYLKALALPKSQKLKKLNIKTSLNKNQLQNLINNLKQLTQLSLVFYAYKNFPKLQGKKLKKITLDGSVTQMELNSLLQSQKQEQNLQYLSLARCQFIQKFQFVNCKKLKYLNLEWTKITDLSQNVTREFCQLQELNLFKCQWIKNIKFKNSLKLKKLNLGCVPIDPNQLQQLSKDLISLEDLSLYKYPYINNCSIKHCKQLKKLNLSYSQIKSQQLKNIIRQLLHLEQLNLNGCKQLQEIKLNEEFYCPKLKKICLDSTKLTEIQLSGKAYLEQLKISQADIGKIIICNCKMFRKINLSLVYDLTAIVLNKLPKLEQLFLELSQIPKINLQEWSSVEKLSFICSNIKSAQLSQFMKKTSNLKYLNLSNSQKLFYIELGLCKSLENVILYYTSLPKEDIQSIKISFPQIQFQTS